MEALGLLLETSQRGEGASKSTKKRGYCAFKYHYPTATKAVGTPKTEANPVPTMAAFDPADLTTEEMLRICEVADDAPELSTEDIIACDLALGQSYADSLRVSGHQRLIRPALDHNERERLYRNVMQLDHFESDCVVSSGATADQNAEESRRLARLAAAGEARCGVSPPLSDSMSLDTRRCC